MWWRGEREGGREGRNNRREISGIALYVSVAYGREKGGWKEGKKASKETKEEKNTQKSKSLRIFVSIYVCGYTTFSSCFYSSSGACLGTPTLGRSFKIVLCFLSSPLLLKSCLKLTTFPQARAHTISGAAHTDKKRKVVDFKCLFF